MKVLLDIARRTQKSGKKVPPDVVERAKAAGATDLEIHDTVLIAALFCLYNKYVDGMASVTPADPAFYERLAERIVNHGYVKLPNGYDHLKTK